MPRCGELGCRFGQFSGPMEAKSNGDLLIFCPELWRWHSIRFQDDEVAWTFWKPFKCMLLLYIFVLAWEQNMFEHDDFQNFDFHGDVSLVDLDSLDRRWPQKSMMPSGKRKRRTGLPYMACWVTAAAKGSLLVHKFTSRILSEVMIWSEFSEWKCPWRLSRSSCHPVSPIGGKHSLLQRWRVEVGQNAWRRMCEFCVTHELAPLSCHDRNLR